MWKDLLTFYKGMELASQTVIVAMAVGSIVGLAVAILFGIHGKPSLTAYTIDIFGISSQAFISYTLVALLALFFILLSGISFLVRDYAFPLAHPLIFLTELFIFGVLPTAMFVYMGRLRGAPNALNTWPKIVVLMVKFSLTHLLLQTSGYYSGIFKT